MTEQSDRYTGPTTTADIQKERQFFNSTVAELATSRRRERAYVELFAAKPNEQLQPPCDLKTKYKSKSVNFHIDYEAHGEANADAAKKTLVARANRGEVLLLLESDMATSSKSDSYDRKVAENGLTRTVRGLGVADGPDFNFVYGIDDARVRAISNRVRVQDFMQSSYGNEQQRLTEVFRNPLLRKELRNLPLRPDLGRAKMIQDLDQLDADPTKTIRSATSKYLKMESIDPQGTAIPTMMIVNAIRRRFPRTSDYADESELALFEIRDEAMTRAILTRLCLQSPVSEEVHVVVGAWHVDGIKKRLSGILQGANIKIEERNLMEPPSIVKPASKTVR